MPVTVCVMCEFLWFIFHTSFEFFFLLWPCNLKLVAVYCSRLVTSQQSRPNKTDLKMFVHWYMHLSVFKMFFWSPRLEESIIFCHWLCLSVPMSVRLTVTRLQIDSSFFVSRWNWAIFGRQFSMWHSTNRCSSIFDLSPLTPKFTPQNLHKIAYTSACMA